MDRLQIKDPSAIIKVGDTQVDVEEGRNAGCGLVARVTTGAGTRQELEKYTPGHNIDPLDELTTITFIN